MTQISNKIEFCFQAPNANLFSINLFDPVSKNQVQSYKLEKNTDTFSQKIEIDDPNLLYLLEIDRKKCFDPFSKALTFSQKFLNPSSFYSQFTFDHSFQFTAKKPSIEEKNLVIYEMHLRGFSKDSSSKVKHPGTFLGVIEKIDHFKSLGINAIQIMPPFAFDPCEHQKYEQGNPNSLCNYWGYNSLSFFSLMSHYASNNQRLSALDECSLMIDELHKAGIAVIFDVVYNHVSSQCRLDLINKEGYFLLKNGEHTNYTGCGNTLNANQNPAKKLILDSLRYFATKLNIDGFRFDLASSLTRDPCGKPLDTPPLFTAIQKDPVLKDLILIAEPWDVGGLYQVGHFPAPNFLQHNALFRDTLRKTVVCMDYQNETQKQIQGSFDKSLNFITCHDGFSLNDLVSYCQKQNSENQENNQDGNNFNLSNNSGIEGATDLVKIQDIREKKALILLTLTLLSKGASMITMKDEYLHTHNGNNNPYCHDSKLNYFNWKQLKEKTHFLNQVKTIIHLKKSIKPNSLITDIRCSEQFMQFTHSPFQILINLIETPIETPVETTVFCTSKDSMLKKFDIHISKK